MAKNRSISYSDYYKRKDRIPGVDPESDDEETPKKPWTLRRLRKGEATTTGTPVNDNLRKAAMKRRLAMRKAGK